MDRYYRIFCKNLSWINVIRIEVRWPVSDFRSVQTFDIDIKGPVSI